MAGAFTAVNLSRLPAPDVVEQLDFEVILAEMVADLQSRDPVFSALLESDPAYKILEVAAYRELLIRQRVNEAAKAVMLAFATGSDLDHIGANYNVARLVIDPGNPDAIPPIPPTYESDEEFRSRIPLSLESYTTAGSEGSYVYHALSASGDVKDASAVSPIPGNVVVYVLSRDGDGTAPSDLLDTVNETLNAERIRPMTDNVTVQSASIVEYAITAQLYLYPGPDQDVILEAAIAAAEDYASAVHRIGYDVSISGVMQALHRPGVQRVELTLPSADITIDDGQAPYCTAINVTLAGTDV